MKLTLITLIALIALIALAGCETLPEPTVYIRVQDNSPSLRQAVHVHCVGFDEHERAQVRRMAGHVFQVPVAQVELGRANLVVSKRLLASPPGTKALGYGSVGTIDKPWLIPRIYIDHSVRGRLLDDTLRHEMKHLFGWTH